MCYILLLLYAVTLLGCGEVGERMREGAAAGAMGMTVPEMRMQQAQAELMRMEQQQKQIELQQRQRQQRAIDNLPHFRAVVVPSLKPIAIDLIGEKQATDPHYRPGAEIIEEAVQLYNQQHQDTPITPLDMDTFYLTDQGRMGFVSLNIMPPGTNP